MFKIFFRFPYIIFFHYIQLSVLDIGGAVTVRTACFEYAVDKILLLIVDFNRAWEFFF
jgi:hypothetical protein